jgi:hypothetical protein
MNRLPQAPENNTSVILNFFKKSLEILASQICHWYQQHQWKILPPVPLVLLIPVANNGNNISLLTTYSELEEKNFLC